MNNQIKTAVKVRPVAYKTVKKANPYFSRENLQWLGIFLVFLALLSLLFMIMSSRRAPKIISKSKPLVITDYEINETDDDENLFENLDFQRIHTEFQASYLDLIQTISSKQPVKGSSDGTIRVDVKKDILLFQTYKTAQNNYAKVLKRVEEHEKEYKRICFARMKKLILAVLYYDRKIGKRVTKFEPEKLIEVGALDEMPVCPRNGEYSIVYKNGRRLFNCSVHGVLKN